MRCARRCATPMAGTRWPARGSWTPSRSRAPTPSARTVGATTRARRSTDASGTSSPARLGLLVVVLVTAASVQDRDGGRGVLARAKTAMPSITLVWADGGYAGKLLAWIQHHCRIVLEIVRKPEGQRTFEVLPRRWVVERTLSWLVRCRRLGRDYERLPEHWITGTGVSVSASGRLTCGNVSVWDGGPRKTITVF